MCVCRGRVSVKESITLQHGVRARCHGVNNAQQQQQHQADRQCLMLRASVVVAVLPATRAPFC